MSLHYLVKYECQKNGVNLKYIINDKSQGIGIAKHLRNDDLLYCTFVTQSAGERIFKIGEHLVKSPDKLNSLCITDRNCY